MKHKALYAAFDLFPSAKGAATHIAHFAPVLFKEFGGGILSVLGNRLLPNYQKEDNIEIFRYQGEEVNYLQRGIGYSLYLRNLIAAQQELKICHFRDPWSGVALLENPRRFFKVIYEVNGLASIELNDRYSKITPQTLEKISHQEMFCLLHCDYIITPSKTIAKCLTQKGIGESKITVIYNGGEIKQNVLAPDHAPKNYGIYLGATQKWQGLDILLKAYAHLSDLDFYLVLCLAGSPGRSKPYRKLAKRLGLWEKTIWLYNLDKQELLSWLSHAFVSFAPLSQCRRNLEQGCCPLKILESMAAGVPVIASDFPCVEEIMQDRKHGRLVRPDRPTELARMVRVLQNYPKQTKTMGEQAQEHILQNFTWEKSQQQLRSFYQNIMKKE